MENKQNIKDLVQKFYPYAKNALGFEHPVRVIMRHDAENAEQSLGKTAYYDPENKLIVLYVTNRHPKDVLRSFSHELVHHAQNCRGDLDDMTTQGHYAKDGKGREIEEEAYLQGNLNVRDWEDSIKFKGENQMNEHYQIAKEELKKLVAETFKQVLDEKKGKYDDGDGKDEKCDYVDCEDEGDKKEKVKEAEKPKYAKSQDKEHDDAKELGAKLAGKLKEQADCGDVQAQYKKLDAENTEAYQGMNSDYAPEAAGSYAKYHETKKEMDKLKAQHKQCFATDIKESKQQEKQVVTETPQQPKEVKESNKTWYNTSLYNKLVSRWTKKGDK